MRFKKIFIILVCLALAINFSSCINGRKDVASNGYLDERIYGYASIRDMLKLTKVQNVSYAGTFIDRDRNILTVRLVYNSAKNIECEELLRIIDDVNRKGLISIGLDVEKNRLVVTVRDINDEIKTELSKLIDMSIIVLEEEPGNVQPVLTWLFP